MQRYFYETVKHKRWSISERMSAEETEFCRRPGPSSAGIGVDFNSFTSPLSWVPESFGKIGRFPCNKTIETGVKPNVPEENKMPKHSTLEYLNNSITGG